VLVAAATSILLALGVSMYRTYSVRTQIATSVGEIRAAQLLVVAAFRKSGTLPLDAPATGIDETAHKLLAGRYVESLAVANGRIDITFGREASPAIASETLSLTPFETVDEHVVWICGNESPGVGLKPLGFASGALQAVHVTTTIDDRYLPPSCR